MSHHPHSGRSDPLMEVDLQALAHNYDHLARTVAPSVCAPVIKADAYGLGMEQVCQALKARGADTFFVASLEEAIALRTMQPEIAIYVLNGLLKDCVQDYHHYRLRPVLNDLEQWQAWLDAAHGAQSPPCAMQIDSGMNRLGLNTAELKRLEPQRMAQLDLRLWMSHFSSADAGDVQTCEMQYQRFVHALKPMIAAPASLANSSGIFLDPRYRMDMVRPGQALYGIGSGRYQVKPVVRLRARLLQCKWVDAGEYVGYDRTFKAQRKHRVGTVALGYRHGIVQDLGQKVDFFYHDHKVRTLGLISMDTLMVDLTDVAQVQVGDWLDIWDHRSDIGQWKKSNHLLNLRELMIRFGRGCARRYR